ncbi:MAG: choice-of-anchor D domain-containing protein [Ignavibacteria bacterium]|nr:choice-of-anchor D domain-containing protein [Ignavibacteria bacterium]
MKILVFVCMLFAVCGIIQAGGAALQVVRPSGGEMLAEGDTLTIVWSGVTAQDTVIIEFSTDNGRSWSLISDQATGLQYQWQIPSLTSDSCIMRVAQRAFPYAAITIPHKLPVTDLTYTADGTKLLTVMNDGTITRWNGLTGGAEYSNSANALYIASSPSGQYFAVTHKDGTGTIWDAYTGLKRTTGFGVTGMQGRISFLNNDTIAMPCLNVSVFTGRYRIPGGYSSDNFGNYNHTKIVNDCRFNSIKTRLISCGDDTAVIRDYRAFVNKVTARLIHSSNVWSVDLSPDASRALTNDKAGNVYYWDALTSTRLAQLGDKSFTMTRMKPDGKYALGGGRIQTIDGKPTALGVVWDLTSMSVVRYLRGHTAGINAVCYSPDGKRMATASADATVKIWDLTESQSAVSNIWRMVQPALTAGFINVKQCFVGAAKDTSFPTALRNLSNATVRIQSIRLTGGDSANFSITNSAALGSILSGNSETLALQFTPNAVRTFSTTVEIITKNQVVRFTVIGEGVERVLGFAPIIDLGRTYLGDRRDTTIRVVLTNSGKQPIEITGTTFTGDGQISIIGGNNAFTLAPSESHTMTFSFTPTKVDTTTASLSFDYNGFGSPAVIPVSAEGICSRGPETISAGSISDILPDQLIHIPIVLSFPTNELRSNIREYSFSVRFNKTVLLPIEPTPFGTEVGNDRVITFSGIQNGNDTLTILHLYTAIGTSEIADIAIENFKWTACGTDAATIVGKVKIAVCTSGGARLYNLTGQTASMKILPNDTKSGTPSIVFHTPESGKVEITLLNFLGESQQIFSGNCSAGDYSLPLELNNLPTGIYFVRMTTATSVVTERIVVR